MRGVRERWGFWKKWRFPREILGVPEDMRWCQ